MKVGLTVLICVAWLTGWMAGPAPLARAQEPSSPLAHALQSVFNPQLAPPKKSMGLLQRSFLDLVESSQQNLQVALVVDGTESMGADLAGVKASLKALTEDLRRYRGSNVSFALVVYRDAGAESGKVTVPLGQFTSRAEQVESAWQSIQPETGAPYFPELVDLGVHTALDQLDWADDSQTTRWILLFGDAPPYDLGTEEADTGARRFYDTEQLVALATRREVNISCILCTCRDSERTSYDAVLDKTRGFMSALASGTGGSMLDLSYPDIRDALLAAAQKPRVSYQRVGVIKKEEVELARAGAEQQQAKVAESRRVRVAILPHLAWDDLSFDPENDAVRLATELRQKFKSIPRVEVKSPVDVERQVQLLKSRAATPQWLPALAIRLRVDYIIWGTLQRTPNALAVSSAIYGNGVKLVEVGPVSGDNLPDLASALMGKAAASEDPELAAVFRQFRDNPQLQAEVIASLSSNPRARQHMLTAFDLLEQALVYDAGNQQAVSLLDQAEQQLALSLQFDKRNALTHLLLANCCFNQAQGALQLGNAALAAQKVQQYKQALERAYQDRDSIQVESVKSELIADYQLLYRKDYQQAAQYYEQLARSTDTTGLHTMLRAHWMLAGIYSGDWGAGVEMADAAQARVHLVQILAHWGDSREAQYVKNNLRWDEEKGENQFEFYPSNALASLF